jgi:hypothetical protein
MSHYDRNPVTGTLVKTDGGLSRAEVIEAAESEDVNTAENTTTFTSSDTTDANATSWTSVTTLSSGEKHKSIFAKISQMFKNIRYLYKRMNTEYVYNYNFGSSSESFTANSYKQWQFRTNCVAGYYLIMVSIVTEDSAGKGTRDSYLYIEGSDAERYYHNASNNNTGSMDTSFCFVGYAVANALFNFKTNPRFTGSTFFQGHVRMYRLSK